MIHILTLALHSQTFFIWLWVEKTVLRVFGTQWPASTHGIRRVPVLKSLSCHLQFTDRLSQTSYQLINGSLSPDKISRFGCTTVLWKDHQTLFTTPKRQKGQAMYDYICNPTRSPPLLGNSSSWPPHTL